MWCGGGGGAEGHANLPQVLFTVLWDKHTETTTAKHVLFLSMLCGTTSSYVNPGVGRDKGIVYVLTRRTYRRHSFGMPAGVFWTRLAGRFLFLQHLDRKFIGADWKRSKVKDKTYWWLWLRDIWRPIGYGTELNIQNETWTSCSSHIELLNKHQTKEVL